MSDYKISVKNPKSDNENKIQGILYLTTETRKSQDTKVDRFYWVTEARLNNLPNPFINPITNLPVLNSEIYIKSEVENISTSSIDESDVLNTSLTDLQAIFSYRYGFSIDLKYDEVIFQPTGPSASSLSTGPEIITTSSVTAPTSSLTTTTSSEPREYTFDVQIKDTFYNSEIGYLTITGKVEDTFIYGDEQDTIDSEYTEEEFLGSEEETLQLSQAAETYQNLQGEIPADTEPSTLNVSESSIDYNDPSFKGADWKNFDINTAVRKIQNTEYKAGKFVESLKKVLYLIKNDSQINDLREAAYLLGTAFAESSYSLQRWEADYACTGQGVPYGSSGPCSKATNYYRLSKGKKDYYTLGLDSKGQCFFGRGLIQLTGKANYETYGRLIGVNLVSNGDLALEPINSYKVASVYMRGRTFKYVLTNNLEKARRSVNGGTKGIEEVNGAYNTWIKVIKESKVDAIA